MVICEAGIKLAEGRHISKGIAQAVTGERMRLSKRSFYRGLGGDFRSRRNGGPRKLLPIV